MYSLKCSAGLAFKNSLTNSGMLGSFFTCVLNVKFSMFFFLQLSTSVLRREHISVKKSWLLFCSSWLNSLPCQHCSWELWVPTWMKESISLLYLQWNSVITYPKGNEKEYVLNKVRSIQSAIYPKCDVRHWESERYNRVSLYLTFLF